MLYKLLSFGLCFLIVDVIVIDKKFLDMQITDVSGITSLEFIVKADKDVHFFLYADSFELVRIIILASAGSCSIRDFFYSLGHVNACAVDPNQFIPFWISWQSDYFRLGYGNIVDQQTIVSGPPLPPVNITYLSLMKYNDYTWEIEYPGDTIGIQNFKLMRHINTRSMSIMTVKTTKTVLKCGFSCKLSTDCFGFNYNPTLSYNNCELLALFETINLATPVLNLQINHTFSWNFYITKFS